MISNSFLLPLKLILILNVGMMFSLMPLILVHVLLPLKTVLKLYKNLKKSKMMEKKKKKKEMLNLKKKKLEKKKKKKKKEMNHHLMKTLKISKKVFSNLNLPHN